MNELLRRGRIAAENLSVWRRAAEENTELRELQMAESARRIGKSMPAGEELIRYILQMPDAPLAREERVAFCRAFLPFYLQSKKETETRTVPNAPRVARLSGPIFAEAMERFATVLPGARSLSVSSVADITEEVAMGNADFGILPLEDAKGTRFLQFYEDFDRLELHMCCSCNVPSSENERDMRFLLFSRQWQPKMPANAWRMLTYRVPGEDAHTLAEFLEAAHALGLALRRVDALPAMYPEDSFISFPVFTAPPEGEALTELYIRLFLPRITLAGSYFHLS